MKVLLFSFLAVLDGLRPGLLPTAKTWKKKKCKEKMPLVVPLVNIRVMYPFSYRF